MLCFLSYVYLYSCNYFFLTNCVLFQKSLHTSAEVWIKNSVIKGYHVYEIRPPMNLTDSPTRLPVDLEYTNITDQHASLVWIPELTYFPTDLHNVTTDEKEFKTK